MVTFKPGIEIGLEFFAMQDELEQLLGCKVDLLTRRSVERSDNPIRRRSILESAREIYGVGTSHTCLIPRSAEVIESYVEGFGRDDFMRMERRRTPCSAVFL